MEINDPVQMTGASNFIDSPPFGLYDILNYLIYHVATYGKQGLDDYGLFNDSYN